MQEAESLVKARLSAFCVSVLSGAGFAYANDSEKRKHQFCITAN